MKTMIMKEALHVPGTNQNRYMVIRAELLRRLINERTGVSQASDNTPDPPHQAQRSAEKDVSDKLKRLHFKSS